MAEVRYDETTVHGETVRWAQAGTSGPVVLLVHGIASRADQWERVMEVLGEHFRVIAPDLLGHGGSAKPRGDYSLGAHACGLRDLLAVLGHDRVTVVGHSLGGGIAMQFAYQFPERVERLALVCAGGLGPEVSVFLRAATIPGAEWVLPALASSPVRSVGASIGRGLSRVGVVVPPGLAESLVGFASLGDRATREAFVHTCRSVLDVRGQRVDGRNRLHLAADLPLLVVWGARDAIIPVTHGTALAVAVPAARLEVFERSGHFPHMTEPARLAAVLADWLATTEAAHLDPAALAARLRDARSIPTTVPL